MSENVKLTPEAELLISIHRFVSALDQPDWDAVKNEVMAEMMARLVIYIHETDVDFDTIDGLVEGKLASLFGENK